MGDRIKPILGAAGITLVLNYIGVTYFFDPQAGTELIAAPLSLVVAVVVLVLFFDHMTQKTGNAMVTAMTIAGGQILMVDFYYVIIGNRDMASAAVSAVVLLVGWYAAATVYQKLS